ncbi:hypothetical protein JOB18_028964 [Solea senegalensis]|uniref:Zinc finger 70-like n=1 Tax=Solea senegalensis TaxID=28829 RepID=A0AAV6PSB1_SOLSE|nr:zinc finger protein 90 homolog [Solea senegalensis]XP_043889883.1 zinc finger protein 90 homolog [Solea senegalensis]XP_043889884.1 zinc finger protein 90 homolog [Solea senegalensis]XP_043889885.1 zinc finger protein 90 homolog [Solea senegalensis]KAG7475301.1 zinc finger 70-like [Solea senegalensis]KAG7475302.1 hypothetical protein JOB18_028964 [Solea senegalensis]KAG7475303.1 hypothetical protein JOB18_028964 [Solea senegalensis]KAG7475304.1 hypothetical protein JOB18_028964 [Solea sen
MTTLSNKMTVRRSTRSVTCNSSKLRSQQRIKMKPERLKPERLQASGSSVEYIVGENNADVDMESDCEREEFSSSSESDTEIRTHSKLENLCPSDPESDGGSNSSATDISSEFPNSEVTETVPPSGSRSICTSCGRGPFKSIKLHLWHCSPVQVKYPCSVCKQQFLTEKDLKEHYMPLYSCKICGQVFSHESSYHQHQCPKDSKLPLVLFCSETMPKACNVCKSFFTSDTTLLNHVTRVHTSVVSTKICIITSPSAFTDKSLSPHVHGTTVQSDVRSPNLVNHVSNGRSHVDQNFPSTYTSPSDRPPDTPSTMYAAASVKLGKDVELPTCASASLSVTSSTTDTTPATEASPVPTILAMFENDSRDEALMKRMNTSWRAKVPYSCRQCGAILRQPSFLIIHRYLHRGRRFHQCQCGRAFKHRLHLLRHCVQHAEAISYICVSCGETFIGARHLAEHIQDKSQNKVNCSGHTRKCKVKQKCRIPFICDCGQQFLRPSAYIWHQLQNWTKINN